MLNTQKYKKYMENRPKVGVGVIIVKDNTILLGKRKNAHGNGTWAPPGGHLEFGESLEYCAAREVMEETGLTLTNLRRGPYTNDIFLEENKHYLTVFMIANYTYGMPEVLEPQKCEIWDWFSWQDLPQPLFKPLANLLRDIPISTINALCSIDN